MTEESPNIGQEDLESFAKKIHEWTETLTDKENSILRILLDEEDVLSGFSAKSLSSLLNTRMSTAFGISTAGWINFADFGEAKDLGGLNLNRQDLGESVGAPPPCEMGFSCSATPGMG
ncbi:MAG: hypothetical protein QF752_03470 [Planctomycetota bacterium]|nr:hypothetical protein [Planctomycetota bacterium]